MKRTLTLVVIALLLCVCLFACAAPQEDAAEEKSITVSVVYDGQTKDIPLSTEAVNLGPALMKEGIIDGEESDYGLFVTTVDGRKADEAKQEWWCITVDGESAQTGVDEIVIEDGAVYAFTLTVGW